MPGLPSQSDEQPKRVWATLLTKSAYLGGCMVLAHTLRQHQSAYPLVVLATPSLPQAARDVIVKAGLILRMIDYIEPQSSGKMDAHDERFADTWTKLAVFGLTEYERVILVDSDVVVRKNMDELMSMELPPRWIAAAHACTCNPRKLKHYPSEWIPENCAHTFAHGTRPVAITKDSRATHRSLNSGLVVLTPDQNVFEEIVHMVNTHPDVKHFVFPDQDLLALFFYDQWLPLGYQYNALKTLPACHPAMWSDADVKFVHYIIDKPWSRPLDTASPEYRVNIWWWEAYEDMKRNWEGDAEWKLIQETVPGDTEPRASRGV